MTYDDWKGRSDRDEGPQPEPESWCGTCQHDMECDCPCCSEPVDLADIYDGTIERATSDYLTGRG
jgi:hypothetical protein